MMSSQPDSVESLVAQLTQSGPSLRGWDVVLHLDEGLANRLLAAQLLTLPDPTWRTLDTCSCALVPNPLGDGQLASYSRLRVTLDTPALSFPESGSVVELRFAVSGDTAYASAVAPEGFDPQRDARPDDPALVWKTRTSTQETLTARVPLAPRTGSLGEAGAETQFLLDFAEASFLGAFVDASPQPSQLSAQVKDWLINHAVQVVLLRVASGVIGQLPAMRPVAFALNLLHTNAGRHLLQLFMVTDGTAPSDRSVNVNEPLPAGYDLSVLASARVVQATQPSTYVQAGLFLASTLIFPGQAALTLGPQFQPADLLVLGNLSISSTPASTVPTAPESKVMLNIQNTRQLTLGPGQTFTVYGDDADANLWYIPPTPVWAVDPSTGQKRFALITYNKGDGTLTGYCTFTVKLEVPASQVQALTAQIPGARLGQFDWQSAAAILTYVVNGSNAIATALPSRYGTQEATFSITLPDTATVNAFINAFSPQGSAGGTFSVSYDLSAQTRLPAVTVETTFDSSIAYKYQVEQRFALETRYHTDTWGHSHSEQVSVYVGQFVTELLTSTQAGTVKVTPGQGLTTELLNMVTSWANQQLAADTRTAVDNALALIRNPSGQSFSMSQVSSFHHTFSTSNVVPWRFTAQANLPPMDQGTWDSHHSEVAEQLLSFTFVQAANLSALGIDTVTLTVSYPTQSQDVSHTFLPSGETTWAQTWAGDRSTGSFNPQYRYKLVVVYSAKDGSRPANLESDWVTTSATTVRLTDASLGMQQITFDASNIDFKGQDIRRIVVDWRWMSSAGAAPQSDNFVLDTKTQKATRTLRSNLPSATDGFTYNLTFDRNNGKPSLSARRLQGTSTTVLLASPIQTATWTVFSILDSDVSRVMLRATFDDNVNGIHVNKSWNVGAASGQSLNDATWESWSFDTVTANINATTITYSGILIKEGKQYAIPQTIVVGANNSIVLSSTQKTVWTKADARLLSFVRPGAASGLYEVVTTVSTLPADNGVLPNDGPPLVFDADSETTQYFSKLVDLDASATFYYQNVYTDIHGAVTNGPLSQTPSNSLPAIPVPPAATEGFAARAVTDTVREGGRDRQTARTLDRHRRFVRRQDQRDGVNTDPRHPLPLYHDALLAERAAQAGAGSSTEGFAARGVEDRASQEGGGSYTEGFAARGVEAPAPQLSVDLGDAVNLILGLRPGWATGGHDLPGFEPPRPATVAVPSTPPSNPKARWQLPTVAAYDDAESLLDALSGVTIAPLPSNTAAYAVSPGRLMIGDLDRAAALAALQEALGLDLTLGAGFMLVSSVRPVGEVVHPRFVGGSGDRDSHLSSEAQAILTTLPTGTGADPDAPEAALTPAQAQQVLDACSTYGTHFVSRIQYGDRLLQVFSFTQDGYKQLKDALNDNQPGSTSATGFEALAFQYYTTPSSRSGGNTYGFTSQAGKVVCISEDPDFATTRAAGAWQDAERGFESLFSAWAQGSTLLHNLDLTVPIGVELAPIAALIPVAPSALRALTYDRVSNGALLQKFGDGMQLGFSKNTPLGWRDVLSRGSSWLSTLSTPSIDASQARLSLDSVVLAEPDDVQSFSAVALVMDIGSAGTVDIPGKSVALSAAVLDTTACDTPPVLRLASAWSFKNLSLAAGTMRGALRVKARGTAAQLAVVDGVVYSAGPADNASGRGTVVVTSTLSSPAPLAVLQAQQTGLRYAMTSARSLLFGRGTAQSGAQALAVAALDWVDALLAPVTTGPDADLDLLQIRLQALYLGRVSGRLGGGGVEVPYLTFETYQPFVQAQLTALGGLTQTIQSYQSQISARKITEQQARNAQEINDNIKKSGQLLTGYIDAMAQNQQDIADNYDGIIASKQKEFDQSVTDLDKLQKLVTEQQSAVDDAVLDFKYAYIAWEKDEIVKTVFGVVTGVFSLAATIAIPAEAPAGATQLVEMFTKIKKLMEVIEQIRKLAEQVEAQVASTQQMIAVFKGLQGGLTMPTAREWSEFGINAKAGLADVPSELKGEAAKLGAAFDILVLRGQALLTAQARQSQIIADLYYNQQQKKISSRQRDRLDALVGSLNLGSVSPPQTSAIDLVGLTGLVQDQLNRSLAQLAETLALQDAAIQYEYLGTPTPIRRFDLDTLRGVMVSQQASILNALNNLNPPPAPVPDAITYKVTGVPVSALAGGAEYSFIIQPSAKEFTGFAMVRVSKVVARVRGIESTTGGTYLLELTCDGNPFMDRDAQGNPLTFDTVQRRLGPYEYDIATGAPRFGSTTGAFADKITQVTPFSRWIVRLPNSATNAGIQFSDITVDLELSFSITALRVDLSAVVQPDLFAARATTAADLSSTIQQMYQNQATLKQWDAVLNLLEEPVNAFIKSQHDQRFGPGKPMTVASGFAQGPFPDPTGDGSFATVTKFEIVLDVPLMQFNVGQGSAVSVTQDVTGGSITIGSFAVPDDWTPPKTVDLNDPKIHWGKVKTVDVNTDPKPVLQASVPLSAVKGLVESPTTKDTSTTHSVVLDFTQGAFNLKNMSLGTNNAQLNMQITDWFANNDVRYLVNTVDFSDTTTLKALQPTGFLLNVLVTNSGKNILQVFIATVTAPPNNLTINVNEPIPDGYHNSLMINTKIMFNDIFVNSFNNGGKNVQVETVDPGNDFSSWQARVKQGSVAGAVDFSSVNTSTKQYRVSAAGNGLTWDITGMTFSRSTSPELTLAYPETKRNVPFQFRSYETVCYGGAGGGMPACSSYWTDWSDHSVDVTISMAGSYPLTVGGDDRLQTLQISATPPTMDIPPPPIEPTGACECNDHDLQIAVAKALKASVPDAVKAQMAGIRFQAVSLFALYNLLFPAENFIKMGVAYVPGDLVVFGTFKQFAPPS